MPMIFTILDGSTDDPILNGKTPFEAGNCAHMQWMGEYGAHGTFLTVPQGLPADSLTCIATLLGVPAAQIPLGRSYLEALAQGLAVGESDVVCRCNLVSVQKDGSLKSACAAGLSAQQQDALCIALAQRFLGQEATLFHTESYKNILLLHGGAKEVAATKTFAPHEHPQEAVETLLPTGTALASRLCEAALQSRISLEGTDYMLLPWDISKKQELPSFAKLHPGLKPAAVCKTGIVRGICAAMGIPVFIPQGATGNEDTNLDAKAHRAIDLIEEEGYNFVLLHINGADELSHQNNPAGKAAFLGKADCAVASVLLANLPYYTSLVFCSDHTTLSLTGKHRGDPQPFLLYGAEKMGNLGAIPGENAIAHLWER